LRLTKVLRGFGFGLALILVGGCEAASQLPIFTAAPDAPEPLLHCIGTFPPQVLEQPSASEETDGAAYSALIRELQAQQVNYPDAHWHSVYHRDDLVEFVASVPSGWACMALRQTDGEWIFDASAESEQIGAVLAEDIGRASWQPASPSWIGSAPNELVLLVTDEQFCVRATEADRITAPFVQYDSDAITIAFGVRAPQAEATSCLANQSTPVLLRLDEEVGERTLLDGSLYPPALRVGPPVDPTP
jgi:hypothetical protein